MNQEVYPHKLGS